MDIRLILGLLAFVMVSSLAVLIAMLTSSRQRRLKSRLQELAGTSGGTGEQAPGAAITNVVRSTLPKVGKHLMPTNTNEQTQLKARLNHAGFYHPQSAAIFLGVKMLLIITPTLIGLAAGLIGLLPTNYGLIIGACASIGGMIGPSLWLDRRKAKRQAALRRSLPDALDLMIVCMDGGLSLAASLQRVTGELKSAHPVLGLELNIAVQEVHFGQPIGDALRSFATRTDLDDIRNLAAAVKNAEKFGASMIKTLRTFAETLRVKRQQSAEEMAQKAGTKILFPTLLFIFPAIFLIILGPAAIQLVDVLGNMRK